MEAEARSIAVYLSSRSESSLSSQSSGGVYTFIERRRRADAPQHGRPGYFTLSDSDPAANSGGSSTSCLWTHTIFALDELILGLDTCSHVYPATCCSCWCMAVFAYIPSQLQEPLWMIDPVNSDERLPSQNQQIPPKPLIFHPVYTSKLGTASQTRIPISLTPLRVCKIDHYVVLRICCPKFHLKVSFYLFFSRRISLADNSVQQIMIS